MMPFITEEMWQLLGQATAAARPVVCEMPAESIMISPWPKANLAGETSGSNSR